MLHGGDTVYVFISMVVLSDSEGYIREHPAALANTIAKPYETVRDAIVKLESPDPESGTPDFDGRRIVPLRELTGGQENRGWFVVNKKKYKLLASKEDQKAATAERVRRHRERNADVTVGNGCETHRNAPVTTCNACNAIHIEITDTDKQKTLSGLPPDIPTKVARRNYQSEAVLILEFLNEKTKRNYRGLDSNGNPTSGLKLIIDRLKSGVSFEDCRSVVALMCRKWINDDKMNDYLRPSTLFRASNFENYLGLLRSPK